MTTCSIIVKFNQCPEIAMSNEEFNELEPIQYYNITKITLLSDLTIEKSKTKILNRKMFSSLLSINQNNKKIILKGDCSMMFIFSSFIADISTWDTSQVTNNSYMFAHSKMANS